MATIRKQMEPTPHANPAGESILNYSAEETDDGASRFMIDDSATTEAGFRTVIFGKITCSSKKHFQKCK